MLHGSIRAGASLCALAFVVVTPFAFARIASPPSRSAQSLRAAEPSALDSSAAHASPHRRLAVFLHGRCSDVEGGCNYFRHALGSAFGLACPRAPVSCPGGGSRWGDGLGTQRAIVLESVLDSVIADPSLAFGSPGVLVGFSEGGYVAHSLLPSLHGRFRGVAFVGANIALSPESLRDAGVRRVVLAAGRGDPTRDAMHATAERLAREGFEARWIDLGAVGHSLASAGGDQPWRDALAWLAASN